MFGAISTQNTSRLNEKIKEFRSTIFVLFFFFVSVWFIVFARLPVVSSANRKTISLKPQNQRFLYFIIASFAITTVIVTKEYNRSRCMTGNAAMRVFCDVDQTVLSIPSVVFDAVAPPHPYILSTSRPPNPSTLARPSYITAGRRITTAATSKMMAKKHDRNIKRNERTINELTDSPKNTYWHWQVHCAKCVQISYRQRLPFIISSSFHAHIGTAYVAHTDTHTRIPRHRHTKLRTFLFLLPLRLDSTRITVPTAKPLAVCI